MKKIRIISLMMFFLLFCLIFDVSAKTDAEVIENVSKAEIMEGTENGFEPLKTLTRAEITAIVVRIKDMEDDALISCEYKDVLNEHWAYNYINIATKNGITKGTGDNLFSPNREVTVAETVTMIVRAISDYNSIEGNGNWPDNYMKFAKENKLLEGIMKDKNDIIQRIDTARIIDNVLSSPNWNGNKEDNEQKNEEEIDEDGKIIVSKAAEGVIVSVAEIYDDYNEIELATPYGIISLVAHDSELTSGAVLPGTYVDFWLSGDRMWDINIKPVTGITNTYHVAKILKFSDGLVKMLHKTSDDSTLLLTTDFEYMEAGNIIFLKCEDMLESDIGDGKILRDFNDLQFGNEMDIELATDYDGLKYSEVDATEVFYQTKEIDGEETIIAMIYVKE